MASVDVCIPVYNYGRYLRECVESVVSQGVSSLRILIIDNASDDDSAAIAFDIAARDPRVSVVARPVNLGLHASWNEGVDWAAADYFTILCADDWMAPGYLANAVEVMEANPEVGFTYGRDVHYYDGDPLPDLSAPARPRWWVKSGEKFIEERCRNPEHYLAIGHTLVRTSVMKKAGHYREELQHTLDLEMLLRLACYGEVAKTKAAQGVKRMHASNRTNDYLVERTRELAERLKGFQCFFAHEGRSMPSADRLMRICEISLAERAYWSALRDASRGRPDEARALRAFAQKLDPNVSVFPPIRYLFRMDRALTSIFAGVARDWALQQRKV